jgi:hypothetical protein
MLKAQRELAAATNAAEATDEADDENYFAGLDHAGNAAEVAAAEITGYKTYVDLLEAPREEMVFDAHDRAFTLFKGTCRRGISSLKFIIVIFRTASLACG